MIAIISMLLMVTMIAAGIVVGLAPNVYSILDRDFMRKVYSNAQLEGLEYGDVLIRAKEIDADPLTPAPAQRERSLGNFTVTEDENGATHSSELKANIKIPAPESLEVKISHIHK